MHTIASKVTEATADPAVQLSMRATSLPAPPFPLPHFLPLQEIRNDRWSHQSADAVDAARGTDPPRFPRGNKARPPCRRRQLRRQRAGVLRLLHLRHRGRAGLPQDLLPGHRPRPRHDPSMATFGVGYVARPVGSPSFSGTSATRSDGKTVLFLTLFGMGVATFLIGCCPPYARSGSRRRSCSWSCARSRAWPWRASSRARARRAHGARPGQQPRFFTSFTLAGTRAATSSLAVFLPIAALPKEALPPGGGGCRSCSAPWSCSRAGGSGAPLHESRGFRAGSATETGHRTPAQGLFRSDTPDMLKVALRRARLGHQHDLRHLRPDRRGKDGRPVPTRPARG